MTELSNEARRALIDDALERKFGDWLHWQKPECGHFVGPSDPGVYDKILEWRDNTVEKAIWDLRHLSDEQLMAVKSPQNEEDKVQHDWWRAYLRYSLPNLKDRLPSPFAVGFGHPSFKTDFEYWAKMPELSLSELVALSVGANPEQLTEEVIAGWKPNMGRIHPPNGLWPTQEFLLKRKEQLSRYFHFAGWGYARMSISKVMAVIDETELEVHPEFYAAVEHRLSRQEAKSKVRKTDDLTNTEKKTLLKLIAAMACEGYKFDPEASRNEATSEIQSDVESIGQSIDQKTILRWLREASDLVHDDFWKDRRD